MKLRPLAQPDGELADRLQKIEAEIGAPLPEDYRRFLLETNGARPEGHVSARVPDEDHTDLQVIYGSGASLMDVCTIEYWLDNRPHPESVVVGNDSGGNHFWISLASRDYGVVHFENLDWEPSCGPVAQSWSDFLTIWEEDG